MATIDEETAKALLTGPLQLQRIYRAIEAARQEGREEMRRAVLALFPEYSHTHRTVRALTPGGVEAGERKRRCNCDQEFCVKCEAEPDEIPPRGNCRECGNGMAATCYDCNRVRVQDVRTRALADVERELFEARSKHLTPPLVYWADIYMVLARLREGSRG